MPIKHLAKEIADLITTLKNDNRTEINENSKLFDEGIIDSLGVINLICKLEDKYQIKIPNDELTYLNFNTIGAIEGIIYKNLNKESVTS